MKKKIVISERPDSVSWEDIRQALVEAHKKNLERGLIVRSTTLSAEQLREQVADGKCFVALDGGKVVGIAAVRIKSCNQWFCQEEVAHFLLDSVLTDYQGLGIYSLLQEKRYAYVNENGICIITTNTAANNERMVKMLPKQGFHRAVMFRITSSEHYSITWVQWLKGEPSPLKRCLNYAKTVLKAKFQYTFYKILHQ